MQPGSSGRHGIKFRNLLYKNALPLAIIMPTLGQHDYPLTTVADAIENAKKIVLQFKGQSFDRKALAAALGNKSAETGAFNQRLADLRRFGIIDGRGETLQVTALAQRVAIPTNSDEFSEAVFEMMTRVPLFKLLYEHTEGKTPNEDELLATLINLTKADRAEVQAVVTRIRNNYLSGLSRMGGARPSIASTPGVRSAILKSDAQRLPLEPENVSLNLIEVRAGEVSLKYPLTKTGLKLMRHNFTGPGFWEILEEQVSKSEAPSRAGPTEDKKP